MKAHYPSLILLLDFNQTDRFNSITLAEKNSLVLRKLGAILSNFQI
jgi:hypothetical protein